MSLSVTSPSVPTNSPTTVAALALSEVIEHQPDGHEIIGVIGLDEYLCGGAGGRQIEGLEVGASTVAAFGAGTSGGEAQDSDQRRCHSLHDTSFSSLTSLAIFRVAMNQ
jgi:hypothetical protein